MTASFLSIILHYIGTKSLRSSPTVDDLVKAVCGVFYSVICVAFPRQLHPVTGEEPLCRFQTRIENIIRNTHLPALQLLSNIA